MCLATFYGVSWIHLSLNESISRLRLYLDFLTGHPGPLISAVGSVDFLYVEVTSSGRVLASVDLGGSRATLVSPPGVSSVADRRWHSVVVTLARTEVRLILDDVFESRARVPGDLTELNVDVGLRLGARFVEVPVVSSKESIASSFRGCLRSVTFNSVDILATARRVPSDTTSRPIHVTWDRSEQQTDYANHFDGIFFQGAICFA